MTTRLPSLFLGHGSPMTAITDCPERSAWQALGRALPRPRAVLVVSAHWETSGRTHVTAGEAPRTIHDFRGFPPELHAVQYPAPGAPWLVERIAALLGEDRIQRDDSWGFDHGAWGVVMPMFPDADIPLVAMSLDRSLDGDGHLALGAALAPLRDEGVLIVGSGNIIHNLQLWWKGQDAFLPWAPQFAHRIFDAIRTSDHPALTRFAPDDEAATLAINSGEHYLPLLYTVGARLPGDEVGFFNDTHESALAMTSVIIGDTALIETAA